MFVAGSNYLLKRKAPNLTPITPSPLEKYFSLQNKNDTMLSFSYYHNNTLIHPGYQIHSVEQNNPKGGTNSYLINSDEQH